MAGKRRGRRRGRKPPTPNSNNQKGRGTKKGKKVEEVEKIDDNDSDNEGNMVIMERDVSPTPPPSSSSSSSPDHPGPSSSTSSSGQGTCSSSSSFSKVPSTPPTPINQGQEGGLFEGPRARNGLYSPEQESRINEGIGVAKKLMDCSSAVSETYFKQYGPTYDILKSYNHFMKTMLPAILTRNGFFEYEEVVDSIQGITRIHRATITKVFLPEYGGTLSAVSGDFHTTNFLLVPHEARIRGLTYSRPIQVTVVHKIIEISFSGRRTLKESKDTLFIGNIPVMVKSEYCSLYGLDEEALVKNKEDPTDPGGYFIINGKEKFLVSQERLAHNQFFIFNGMAGEPWQLQAEIRSTSSSAAEEVSALWIRIPGVPHANGSAKEKSYYFTPKPSAASNHHIGPIHDLKKKILKKHSKGSPGLQVYHFNLKISFPLLILYKALGFLDDKFMFETIGFKGNEIPPDAMKVLQPSLSDEVAEKIKTKRDALIHIGKLRKVRDGEMYVDKSKGILRSFTDDDYYERGMFFITEEVLPGVTRGIKEGDCLIKAYHIGYMVNRLISAFLGWIPCDDRDHIQNKRFDLPGALMTSLIKRALHLMMANLRYRLMLKVNRGIEYNFFHHIWCRDSFKNVIDYAFNTGNWGNPRTSGAVRQGVAQPLNRMNGIAALSYMRRIKAPVSRLNRMVAPRQLHCTHFGYLCPVDTPEGEVVGLLKNLAVMAQVSVEEDSRPVLRLLQRRGYNQLTRDSMHLLSSEKQTKIFVNGKIMGTYDTPKIFNLINGLKLLRRGWDEEVLEAMALVKRFRDTGTTQTHSISEEFERLKTILLRRPWNTPISMSIAYDREYRELRIRTDGGRPLRPLLTVQNNLILINRMDVERLLDEKGTYGFENLVKEGKIEFIDAAEEEHILIAMNPGDLTHPKQSFTLGGISYDDFRYTSYTHCEIDLTGMLGVCASLIPFLNHNQAPRITYQTNMLKQAVGAYPLNFPWRYDNDSHLLCYGQKQLVTCQTGLAVSKFNEHPAGVNAVVAIMSYTGYNQEDSLIMNGSAIQRGLFRSLHFKVRHGMVTNKDEEFGVPHALEVTKFLTGQRNNYKKLDWDGLPIVGEEIVDQDALIGKTQRIPEEDLTDPLKTKYDVSEIFKIPCHSDPYYSKEEGDKKNAKKAPINPSRHLVDNVILFNNGLGFRECKVRLRSVRSPQLGDKFTSLHGQKGVIGMTMNQEDMPFTKEGIVPDIIINPHGFPSRMTIGHLLEMVDAKVGALQGRITDRPQFSPYEDKDSKMKDLNGKDLAFELGKAFRKYGFTSSKGMEVIYNGYSGRKFNAHVYIGPCFYQRLKHMTEDKIRFRSRGQVALLTRQPVEGMSREGGLRFGEMERDSAIAHGGSFFLLDRMFKNSDYYSLPICKKCGQIAETHKREVMDGNSNASGKKGNPKRVRFLTHYKCRLCNRSDADQAAMVELPFATKLLFQELMSMNVKVMVTPEKDQVMYSSAKPKGKVDLLNPDNFPSPSVPSNFLEDIKNGIDSLERELEELNEMLVNNIDDYDPQISEMIQRVSDL